MSNIQYVDNIFLLHNQKNFSEALEQNLHSDLITNFNGKINDYTRAIIKKIRASRTFKTKPNPVTIAFAIKASREAKSHEKEIKKFLLEHASKEERLDSYINKMLTYFLKASNFYQEVKLKSEHSEINCVPAYMADTQMQVIEESQKLFMDSLFIAPTPAALKNLHKTKPFSTISQSITIIAEVLKDDELSKRNALKCYHPDQVQDMIFSQAYVTNKTILKLRPRVRALYSFFRKQVEENRSPMVVGQMLCYVDMISKTYQQHLTSKDCLMQTDAKYRVAACTMAMEIIHKHFKYFAPNGMVYPINAKTAIADFKDCKPYSPAGKVKPVGCVKNVHKVGIYAKPRVKITLAERDENLDVKEK